MLKRSRLSISFAKLGKPGDKHTKRLPLEWKHIFRGWRQRSRRLFILHQLLPGSKVVCCAKNGKPTFANHDFIQT
jgi:hypothetical protein